jgi:sugar/nucleoside kinase (ribokinase family)
MLEEVIVTRGDKGGLLSTRPFHFWDKYEASIPEKVKCVVGAGDTFNGAYLKARFVQGLSPESSCNYASQVAGKRVSTELSAL